MYTLYGRPGSGSFAVQVALEEIGAPYERIWVGSEAADVARFRMMNPTGRVPALMLPGGAVIFESAAMLIHLALTHPRSALAPPPANSAHAVFLQWMVFLSANIYEAALRAYYPARYSARGDVDADAIRKRGTADYRTHLEVIGHALGPYVLGGIYSIADVYLHMLASWYPGDRIELNALMPKLQAHGTLVAVRPAVAKVQADHAQ
jgi:glutathione S-transferase